MPVSDLTAHTYELPTCTLEVSAEVSALSPWVGRTLIKSLEFDLRCFNPDQPEAGWQIKGDRQQLEALSTAVTTYVQQLLAETSHRLTLNTAPFPWEPLKADPTADSDLEEIAPDSGEIWLQPHTLLSHQLHLGSLATETDQVELSVSQLFDLASALEAWPAEGEALPGQSRQFLSAIPIWLRSTAIAAVVVGVTTTALQLTQQPLIPTASLNQQPETTTLPPVALNPPLPPPGALVVPSPSPSSSLGANSLAQPANPSALPGNPKLTTPPEVEAGLPSSITLSPPRSLPIPPPPPIQMAPPPPLSIPAAPESSADMAPSAESENQAELRRDQAASAPLTSTFKGRANSESAFATLPQVSEVQSYFAQRWQPPAELSQTLQYSLLLNPDGSLQRVMPLTQASKIFLDRTPMPLANEPFVSPVTVQGQLVIRLVLEKSGRVQAFIQ
jgi:hypothetical protein